MSTQTQKTQMIPVEVINGDKVNAMYTAICQLIANDLKVPEDIRVVFGDGPKGFVGYHYPEVKAIAINLDKILDDALDMVVGIETHLNIMAVIHMSMLATLAHEFHHVHLFATDSKAYADEKKREILADEYAESFLVDLARNYRCEPPAVADSVYFAPRLMEIFQCEKESEEKDEGIGLTLDMLENGYVYFKDGQGIKAFYEYVLANAGKEIVEQPTTQINAIIHKEDDTVVVAAPDKPEVTSAVEEAAEDLVREMEAQGVVEDMAVEDETEGLEPVFDTGEAEYEVGGTYTQDTADEPEMLGEGLVDTPYEAPASASAPTPPPAPVNPEEYEVKLPANVVAEQQTIAQAAQGMAPQQMSAPFEAKPMNLPVATIQAAGEAIYMRLYGHIFNKCGWTPGVDMAFSAPTNVVEGVPVEDILTGMGASGMILGFETVDANGQRTFEKYDGHIRGFVFKNKQLPAYKLFLNINGEVAVRLLLPQNAAKPSKWGVMAKQGHAIMHIKDDVNNTWKPKIVDSKFVANS